MTQNTSHLHCRTQKDVLALVCWRFHVTRLPIVTDFCYDTSTMKNINLVEKKEQLVNIQIFTHLPQPWPPYSLLHIIQYLLILRIKLLILTRSQVFITYLDRPNIQASNVLFSYIRNVVLGNLHAKYFMTEQMTFCQNTESKLSGSRNKSNSFYSFLPSIYELPFYSDQSSIYLRH